ncbi:MAG: RHS repeat-associated core domain-containing protein [Nitrospira sp.]
MAFPIHIDARQLAHPQFFIPGVTTQWTATHPEPSTFQMEPGTYTFSIDSGQGLVFTVTPQGLIDYDPALDVPPGGNHGIFQGRGTATLTLVGFAITLDARALAAPKVAIGHLTGWLPNDVPQVLHLLPGPYEFQQEPGLVPAAAFTVRPDGTIDYAATSDGFLSGRGTSTYVLHGLPITLDARALAAPKVAIGHLTGWLPNDVPQVLHLLPGPYEFQQEPGLVPAAAFTVRPDGTIDYAATSDGFLSGRGTSTYTLHGLPITLDARALANHKFAIGHLTHWLPNDTAHLLHLLPGAYEFQQDTGLVPTAAFEVRPDGTIDYATTSDGFLSGRGTDTFTLLGYVLLFDVSEYHGVSISLDPLGVALDTSATRIHTFRLLPETDLSLTIRSDSPKTVLFALERNGTITLKEPYLFVELDSQDHHPLLRLIEIPEAGTALALLRDPFVSGYLSGNDLAQRFPDTDTTGQYWIRSGIAGFANDAAQHFYLPERYTDPFGNVTSLEYDARDLYVASSTDVLGNHSEVTAFDYRVLAPREIRDINENLSEVAFDVLGLPTATAVKGKGTEGDSLDGVNVDPDLATRLAYFTENFDLDRARQLLGRATGRQIYYFGEIIWGDGTIQYGVHPPCAAAILREQHVAALGLNQEVTVQVAFEYSDGSGNLLVKKSRAEPATESKDQTTPAQLIIDDFTSGAFHSTYATRHGEDVINSHVQTGAMSSGQRNWQLLLRGETGQQAAVDIQGTSGFRFTSDMGVGHRFDWDYGGVQTAPLALDLHEYNALRFQFLEVPRGLNFNILLYFRGQLDNYAQLGVNILPHTKPFDLDFSFDRFRGAISFPTRPAQFSYVSRIYIVTQSGGYFADGGESFALRAISAVSLPRWIASGKTILNNKGKPVKQYEPYFTDSHVFHEPIAMGVTPLLYYDAAGRMIRTEFPDGTFSRVEFSPWHVRTYDQNDTVKDSRWYAERNPPNPYQPLPRDPVTGDLLVTPDQRAAWLAAQHHHTPAETHLDSQGREVISLAHNRTPDVNGAWQDEKHLTFTKLDAEGKPLWIVDARGNLVMQYITPPKSNHTPLYDDPNPDWRPAYDVPAAAAPCYDIAGNLLFQHSMDAGDRWMLNDAAGKPMLAWDLNDKGDGTAVQKRLYQTDYDQLHRPTAQWLTIDAATPALIEAFEYCDTNHPELPEGGLDLAAAIRRNLIGQAIRHWDPSGKATVERIDLSGKPAHITRSLIKPDADGATGVLGWPVTNRENLLDGQTFHQITEYDALSRMTKQFNWHQGNGSRVAVYLPLYGERGVLKSEKLIVGATKDTSAAGYSGGQEQNAIAEIRYNVKGQREWLKLGNGVTTTYSYDARTFRLIGLRSERAVSETCSGGTGPMFENGRVVQDLHYWYDPVGNITEIADPAFKTVFFDNQAVKPINCYEYDALYRLIVATGRENGAASGAPTNLEGEPLTDHFPCIAANAFRQYSQRYRYDAVGNIQQMRHEAGPLGSWTRDYAYAFEDSHQPASNRLWQTWTGGDQTQPVTYHYDTHGSMLNLANVPDDYRIHWDHRDMIASINLGGGGHAQYQYDAGKQRTRKFIQRNDGSTEERLYLGGLELYRRRVNGEVKEQIETLHLFDGEQRLLMVDQILETDRSELGKRTLYRYTLSNHLGSSTLELDEQAALISYEEYHPYGTSAYRAGRNAAEVKLKRYRYTGKERDEESGLYYHGARYYAAWLSRWMSCDPLGLEDGTNRYVYVRNNPSRLIDPSGQNGNDPQDILKHIYYQAGFEQGQSTPQTGAQSQAVWGQRAHLRTESVHRDLVNAGVKDAERIVMAPAINKNTGVLTKVGGNPIRGHDNPDTLVFPKGQVPPTGSVITPGQADIATDFKYGGGEITTRQASYAKQGVTINADYQGGSSTAQAAPATANTPVAGTVNLSAKDADLDPATGRVVAGPNTSAAQARAAASTAQPPASPKSSQAGGPGTTTMVGTMLQLAIPQVAGSSDAVSLATNVVGVATQWIEQVGPQNAATGAVAAATAIAPKAGAAVAATTGAVGAAFTAPTLGGIAAAGAGAVSVAAGAVAVAGVAGYAVGTGINQSLERSGASAAIDRFLDRAGVYDLSYRLFFK